MNEKITKQQAAALLFIYVAGGSLVIGTQAERQAGGWLAVIAGGALAVLVFFAAFSPLAQYPKMSVFLLFKKAYGRVFGGILNIVTAAMAIVVAVFAIGLFTELAAVTALRNTPRPLIAAIMAVIAGFCAASGISTVGRMAQVIFPVFMIFVLLSLAISMSSLDADGLSAAIGGQVNDIINGSWLALNQPFSDLFYFIAAISLAERDGYEKTHRKWKSKLLSGFWHAGLVVAFTAMRNVALLGPETVQTLYFPSYAAAGILEVSRFLQRTEALVSAAFLCAIIGKTASCLCAAAGGFASVFGGDYKKWVVPVCAVVYSISVVSFSSTMAYFRKGAAVFGAFSPVLLALPLLSGLCGLVLFIKKRRREKSAPPMPEAS